MNKSKLIGGLIMVTVAVLLAALYFILPEGQVTFMVEGKNMPFVPSIVMGVIGIIMLAGAGKKEEKKEIVVDEKKAAKAKPAEVKPEAGKEPMKVQAKAKGPKALTKAQKEALESLQFAQTLDEVMAAVADLKPEERADKRVGFPVHLATERIVNKVVPLP